MCTRSMLKSFLSLVVVLTGFSAMAADKSPKANDKAASEEKLGADSDSGADKIDVTDIEKKYWASKDTDFSVVQNRTYTKVKRFGLSGGYGFLVNDAYSDGPSVGLGLNYFFSDRYGVEFSYVNTSSKHNKAVEAFIRDRGATPDHGKIRNFYGASFNWIPIYAKMSFLNSKIIYFDMSFSPGLGMTTYEQQIEAGAQKKNAPTVTMDVTQWFFFNNYAAFRLDYKNRWFNEDIAAYRVPGGSSSSTLRTEVNYTSILMFGLTLFY